MHAADRMATDKLKEGIEGFSAALVKLETLLAKRLAELESRTPGERSIRWPSRRKEIFF
jgi:transaldolase